MLKRIFYRPPPEGQNPGMETAWSAPAEFDEAWKRRIETMSRYIDGPGTVADFGCGMMWLKPLLSAANSYLGIDFLPRGPGTMVVDLNRDSLEGIRADVAFLSGVLEYIEDLPDFVRKLKQQGFRQIIASYCTLEKHPNMEARRNCSWVSHESILSLLHMFLPDYHLTHLDDVNGNTILVFTRKVG